MVLGTISHGEILGIVGASCRHANQAESTFRLTLTLMLLDVLDKAIPQ